MRKKILWWFISKFLYRDAFIELNKASKQYAIYSWFKNHRDSYKVKEGGKEYIRIEFLATQKAFVDGYLKSIGDNELRFKADKINSNIHIFK